MVYITLRSVLPYPGLLVGGPSHWHGSWPALLHVLPTPSCSYRISTDIHRGLGVRENTLVGLFGGLDFTPEVSTAMSLLGYVAGILASLLGGVAFVMRRIESDSSGEMP